MSFPEHHEGHRATAAPPARRVWTWAVASLLLAAGILAAVLLLTRAPTTDPSPAPTRASDDLAYSACREAVKQRLKSPGTAKFGGEFLRETGEATAEVGGWVDSENGFSALIRNRYVCIAHAGQTGWRISDVTFTDW